MKKFGAILAMLGILLVLGTAGASDRALIELDQILIQSIIGAALTGVGVTFVRIGERLEELRDEQEDEDA